MFRFVANIGFARNRVSPSMAWKTVGRLCYCEKTNRAYLHFHAIRFGMMAAKPEIDDPPFMQGDIISVHPRPSGEIQEVFLGFITTAETETGDVLYSVHIECLPCHLPGDGLQAFSYLE